MWFLQAQVVEILEAEMKKKIRWIIFTALVLYLILPPHFPTIKFVDELPLYITKRLRVENGRIVVGTYTLNTNTIHVLNRPNSKATLFHELIHWQIEKLYLPMKVHNWFDKAGGD